MPPSMSFKLCIYPLPTLWLVLLFCFYKRDQMSCFCPWWLAPSVLPELTLLWCQGCKYLKENVSKYALICFKKSGCSSIDLRYATHNFLSGVLWASINGCYIWMRPWMKKVVKGCYYVQAKCFLMENTQLLFVPMTLQFEHIHNFVNWHCLTCLSNFIGTILQQGGRKLP